MNALSYAATQVLYYHAMSRDMPEMTDWSSGDPHWLIWFLLPSKVKDGPLVGMTSFHTLPSSHAFTLTSTAMPLVLSIVLSLFGVFLLQLLLDLRRVARDVGFVFL